MNVSRIGYFKLGVDCIRVGCYYARIWDVENISPDLENVISRSLLQGVGVGDSVSVLTLPGEKED